MILELKLGLRSLGRRKARMALIGALVAFGTFLIVFGTIFASSASKAAKAAIVDKFTGDFIVYSGSSKELPSPFAFQTPLPKIRDEERVEAALAAMGEVEAFAPYAQNYGIVQADRGGLKYDLPIIYYAIEPSSYARVFGALSPDSGSYFGLEGKGGAKPAAASSPAGGVMISAFQNEQYAKNFGVQLSAGEGVTLLGVTEGGVNAVPSVVRGLFTPKRYASVFNYINFMDADTYGRLYDYAGVESLPPELDAGLAAADSGEDAIFALAADPGKGAIDLSKLKAEKLSGATMIAVRLAEGADASAVISRLESDPSLGIKVARWDEASGFYAQISAGLQAFIYLATALIFLVVAMIFMNTLIISVTERTSEIGMMRAIGAERSFVRRQFLAEALVLNLSAAMLGLAASAVAVAAAKGSGIALPELAAQFLVGGGAVPIRASPWPFALGLAVVAAVSVLATLYPVSVATRITPLAAMNDR